MTTFLKTLIETMLSFLPDSPFQEVIAQFKDLPFLGYINYFIPIKPYLIFLSGWLVAIGLYYLVQTVLRWLNVIGS